MYNKKNFKMNIESNKSINEVLTKFLSLINEKKNNIIFIYKGKKISFKFENIFNKLNHNNIIISVFNIKNNKNTNVKFNYFICPKCYNLSFSNINNNNNLSLDNCINNHKFDDILIHGFIKNQNNYLDNIVCNFCKNNKNLYNNNFYRCSCGKNICKLCLENHRNENHNIIEFNKRYKICINHEKEFISYCKDCKMNLCEKCENNQYKHKIILYKMMINKIDIKEMKNKLNNNIERINEYKEQIDKLSEIYNGFILNLKSDLEDSINLINKIFCSLDSLDNYETIINIIKFKLEILNIDSKNIKNKFLFLIDIFERYKNEMDIFYEIENTNTNNEIEIFGKEFAKNNKKIIYMINDNKIYNLKEKYKIDNKEKKKKFKIKLLIIKNINNISKMFYECAKLSSLPDILKWNTSNVTDMNQMFYRCKKLSSLPDISKWNTNNVTNMNQMFYGCNKLSSLPNISNWNTNNITNINQMFYGCSNLLSLPDISKLNTDNVTNMDQMFYECAKLSSLPDISKWNISNITDMSQMFYGCKKLSSLPDISKWNTSNVTDMSQMFYGCNKLLSLPDISIWNTNNLNDISEIFYECKKLTSIPDISNWHISNLTNMGQMFYGCNKLLSLPDISIWNTINVTDMSQMLYGCAKLSSLPDISI